VTYTFIAERCSDLPVPTVCRVMKVSTSAYYAWRADPVRARDWVDAHLTNTIVDIHRLSRRCYGSSRVHAELRLGQGLRCARKGRAPDAPGRGRRDPPQRRCRRGGCTLRDPAGVACEDLVKRLSTPPKRTRLWVMGVTEHPTGDGKAYLAVVLDAFSRRVVGWSIADHIRSELVVDARRPCPQRGQAIISSRDHLLTRPRRGVLWRRLHPRQAPVPVEFGRMSVCSSIPRLSRVRCSTQASVSIRTPSTTSGFSPLAFAEIHKKSLRDAAVSERQGRQRPAPPTATEFRLPCQESRG
jgi:hypothetical protein